MSQANNHTASVRRQIVVRALVLNTQNELLLVAHEPPMCWYTPGGRLVNGETLKDGVKREVYEETGLQVEVDRLVYVEKFFDAEQNEEKIEFYFLAAATSDSLEDSWVEGGGLGKHVRFFKKEEIAGSCAVLPTVLHDEL